MATLFKKTVTRPMPADAKIVTRKGKQVAQWTDRRKRKRSAKVTTGKDGSFRIRTEAATWTAKYRDGDGIVREVSTGCRDKESAQSRLRELTTRADKVRGGILTSDENRAMDHQHTAFADHIDAYIAALRNKRGKGKRKRVSPEHVENVERAIKRLQRECNLRKLRDVTRERIEQWVTDRLSDATVDTAVRTINAHVAAIRAFGNWCVDTHRLTSNPLQRFSMLDETGHQKRPRRSLTEKELSELLMVARLRPVAEFGRRTVRKTADENPTGRRTWTKCYRPRSGPRTRLFWIELLT